MIASLTWLALLAPAAAQSTAEPWRTVETPHHRVHYPEGAEAWALDSAARFEVIRERVAAEVGFAPPQVVDVVVMDPFTGANGFVLPFLGAPRMSVFPTAPEAGSGIANYRLWSEDLVVHEDAHLAHLLRPSRAPIGQLVGTLTGAGPIALKSPAWVTEGYATVVEGRLTGFGRPYSATRAAWLRGLAQDGQLPPYEELDASARWGAGSMRYLVGSAYLEWLDRHHSPHPDAPGQSFRDLWARMTARQMRSFDEAFLGVYGDDPAALYARFVAETTAEALAIDAGRPSDEGTLWLDLEGSTGAPDLSADGSKLVLVQDRRSGPSRLVVYDTAPDPEAEQEWREAVADALEADPQDVAPVPPRGFGRDLVATRVDGGRIAASPRFLPDGRVLFTAWVPDGRGDLVPDLFVWSPERGREGRVTRGASVRDADPYDGSAVAVWTSGGSSALVQIDLATGAARDLTAPGPTVGFDQPRVSPDGRRVAVLRHEGRWGIGLVALDDGAQTPIPLPDGAEPFGVAWASDDALLASLGRGGFVEIWRLDLATGAWSQLTHGRGGAYAPAPAPDGALFYLSPDAEGLDVHRLAPGAGSDLPDVVFTGRTGVTPPAPVRAPPLAEARPLEPARPYGLGPHHARPLIGGLAAPGQWLGEVGLFLGDPIGRSELVALGAFDAHPQGGSLAWTWRGLPVRATLQGFALADERAGGALDLAAGGRVGRTTVDVAAGAWGDRSWAGGEPREAVHAGVSARSTPWLGAVRLAAGFAADGQLRPDGWLAHGHASLGFRAGAWGASAAAEGWAAEGVGLGLGGPRPSYLPDGLAASRAWIPWLAPRAAEEPILRARAALTPGAPAALFGERVMAGDEAWTLIGLDAGYDSDAQPIGRVPGASIHGGLGCRIEGAPENDAKPCLAVEDWSAWASVRWVPGRPVGLP